MHLKSYIMQLGMICLMVVFLGGTAHAQITSAGISGANQNKIPTSVPFLTITPDAQSAGMGDFGVAGLPGIWSQHHNVARYPFTEASSGLGISYTPWLTNLVPGLNLFYVPGYYALGVQSFSMSVTYFSLGEVTYTGPGGSVPRTYHPYETAVDAGYSRRLGDHLSAGAVLRYIYSNLTSGQTGTGTGNTRPGSSLAADLGIFYRNETEFGSWRAHWSLGASISNMGPPVSYTDDHEGNPIPTNLGLGGSFSFKNENHAFMVVAGADKLLVPTPPVFMEDSLTGEHILVRGKMAPESVIGGMIQSFYDAPGVLMKNGTYSVLREELNEINYSIGLEYQLMGMFAVRTGYHFEHPTKGNRRYLTLGVAIRYQSFILDFSYLRPAQGQNSPLANTLRVAVSGEFGNRFIHPGDFP